MAKSPLHLLPPGSMLMTHAHPRECLNYDAICPLYTFPYAHHAVIAVVMLCLIRCFAVVALAVVVGFGVFVATGK
jgi:hypothetical protein